MNKQLEMCARWVLGVGLPSSRQSRLSFVPADPDPIVNILSSEHRSTTDPDPSVNINTDPDPIVNILSSEVILGRFHFGLPLTPILLLTFCHLNLFWEYFISKGLPLTPSLLSTSKSTFQIKEVVKVHFDL